MSDDAAFIGRRNGIGLSAYYFLSLASQGFVVAFVPLYVKSRGITLTQFGLLSALYAIAGILTQLPVGILADRLHHRRPLILVGTAVLGGSYLLYNLAHSFPQFCVLYLLTGSVFFTTATLTSTLISDWTAKTGNTASVFGGTRIWGSIGFIVTLAIVGAMPKLVSGGNLLPMIAVLFLMSGFTMLPIIEPVRIRRTEHARFAGVRKLLSNRNLSVFLVSYLIYGISQSSTMSYFSLFIQSIGGTKQIIAWALVVAAVVEIPFMVWVGRASDRIGRRPPLVIAFLTLPLRLFFYSRLVDPGHVFYIQLFHGLTFSFMLVSAMAFVADLSEGDRATAQGLLSMSNAIAMAAGPSIGGFVADHSSISAMYGMFSIIALVGGLIFVLFVRESHPDLADASPPVGGPLFIRPIRRILRAPVINRGSDRRLSSNRPRV